MCPFFGESPKTENGGGAINFTFLAFLGEKFFASKIEGKGGTPSRPPPFSKTENGGGVLNFNFLAFFARKNSLTKMLKSLFGPIPADTNTQAFEYFFVRENTRLNDTNEAKGFVGVVKKNNKDYCEPHCGRFREWLTRRCRFWGENRHRDQIYYPGSKPPQIAYAVVVHTNKTCYQ